MRQHTINEEAHVSGIGVHSGRNVNLRLSPAPEHRGIIFRRIDLNPIVEIPALEEYVVDTRSCTCLGKEGCKIATIEHLMAALFACGIDNAYVDVDAQELPILDGSAAPFLHLIEQAGVREQNSSRKIIRVKRDIIVHEQDKFVKLEPYAGLKFSCEIAYVHPCFNAENQRVVFEFSKEDFIHQVAAARTFGFYADYEFYRKNNLALGASLDNTVVFNEQELMNADGLRYPDEMVKHKLLDAIGDLFVSGYHLQAAFATYKGGHNLNHKLLQKLFQEKEAWEFV